MIYLITKRAFLSLFFLHTLLQLTAQTTTPKTIYGIVTNDKDELLIGASVFWKDRSTGTNTDVNGAFHIAAKSKPDSLMVQYVGYQISTVEVLPGEDSLWIVIEGVTELKTVDITEHRFGNSISTIQPLNVEQITSKELKKAPCCNLSESFETNGTVDVAFPNALTGVKEIQMLGLRGIYSQFTLENRPALGGIATPFAFEFVPGTWLEGISLAKGASSVVNGNAGISGQVNAELVKPLTDKPVFVNLFTSTEGRAEANIHLNKKKNADVANGLLMHGSFVKNQWDRNNDQFYDMPNRHQLNALYRHMAISPKACYQWNVQALSDRRTSGQISAFDGQNQLFRVQQNNDRVEAWGKYGLENVGGKPYQQIGNILSATWHRTNSAFGPNKWYATQQSMYWQTLYQNIIGTTDHKYVIAPSLNADIIEEKVNELVLDRKEFVPGIMAEYTFNHQNLDMGIPDFTLVAGSRLDWNSRFQKWLFTPRMSAKYNFSTESIVRVSAGRGYRSPNLIAENVSLLASNRAIQFASDLGLESAWNYGVNFTHNFKIAGKKGNFAIDLYRTDFTRQILVDVDQSPLTVYFYNVDGKAYSQIAMAVLQYNFFQGFEAKISAKWQDVQSTYQDGIRRMPPLTPNFRGLVTLDYTTPNKKWMFNARTQIVGPQRLPDNSQVPHELLHGFPEKSATYSLWNAQVTYMISPKLEFYLGGENLTNFQQHRAIIAYNTPESPYFNGSQLWAPMGGSIIYLGARMTRF